jgi:hypothetical protein
MAQKDSSRHPFDLKLGVYYSSYLHYYGRRDSVRASGTFPMAELWFRKKYYVNAAPVFTFSGSGASYAGSVTTLGYFKTTKKFLTHLYVVKPWYKNNSLLPQSALKAQVAAIFSKLGKVINITAGGDLKFSSTTDAGLTLGIDHIFRKVFSNKIVVVVDPAANLYFGSQRFSQSRYEKNGLLFLPGSGRNITEEVSKFRLLSFETSIPLIVAKGKWMVLVTPSFVMPQNLLRADNEDGFSEVGQNTVYCTMGIKYTF